MDFIGAEQIIINNNKLFLPEFNEILKNICNEILKNTYGACEMDFDDNISYWLKFESGQKLIDRLDELENKLKTINYN